jgi:hypothetical protein
MAASLSPWTLAGASSKMVAVVAPMDPLVVRPKWAITPSEPSSAMALAFSKVRAYHGVALRVKGKRNRAVSVRCSVVLSEKCPGDFKTEWDESLNKHGKIELNDIRSLSSESSIIFELERMALG